MLPDTWDASWLQGRGRSFPKRTMKRKLDAFQGDDECPEKIPLQVYQDTAEHDLSAIAGSNWVFRAILTILNHIRVVPPKAAGADETPWSRELEEADVRAHGTQTGGERTPRPCMVDLESHRGEGGLDEVNVEQTEKSGEFVYGRKEGLGEGGYGVVYKAIDEESREAFAVKSFKMRNNDTPQTVSTRIRQQKSVVNLIGAHDHVLALYGPGFNLNKHEMFFVFMGGGTVEQEMSNSIPNSDDRIQRAMFYGEQVADGLGHLHGLRIVHRDLKPSNFLLDSSRQRAVISDFDTAAVLEEGSGVLPSETIGTFAYMSPEVARSAGHGTASDIWGLGVSLLHMCSQQLPYGIQPNDRDIDCLRFVFQYGDRKPFDLPTELPALPRAIISDCLHWEPEDRPTAVQLQKRFCRPLAG